MSGVVVPRTGPARGGARARAIGYFLTPNGRDGEDATEVRYHGEGRFREVRSYDPDAPLYRRWSITATDRETGEHVHVVGESQRAASEIALRQIGAVA